MLCWLREMRAVFGALLVLSLAIQSTACLAEKAEHGGVEVLIEGSPIQGANGMAADPGAGIWVASVLGGRLVHLSVTGKIKEVRGLELGVETPDDITFGPDGTQYFTNFYSGTVVAIDPDGIHRKVADVGVGANPIAFTRDGTRLFVGRCFFGDALYEIDTAGEFELRLVAENLSEGAGCGANGMAFGPDGLLYAPQTLAGRLIRIHPDSGEREVLHSDVGPLFNGVAFHPRTDELFGVSGNQVLLFDLEAGERKVVAEMPHVLDKLVFDGAGRLFVSSFATGEIWEVYRGGGTRAVRSDVLAAPQGLALAPDGKHLFVASGPLVLVVDTATGDMERELPWAGFLAMSLHLSADQQVLVGASSGDNVVAGLDPETGEVQFAHHDFSAPVDALLLPDGTLVVAEAGGTVVRVGADDTTVRETLANELGQPAGLLWANDALFVADYLAGKVYRLMQAGEVLSAPELVLQGLEGPEGLAMIEDGMLLVAEAGLAQVTAYDLETGVGQKQMQLAAETGRTIPGFPPSQLHHGVAAGPGGVYVADNVANKVLRLGARGCPGGYRAKRRRRR